MKKYLPVLLLLAVFSCKKGTIEMESTEIGIDPFGNKNALSRSIQLKGHYQLGDLPVKDNQGLLDFILVAPQDTIEIGDETPAFIPVTVRDQAFVKMCGMNLKVVGSDGYWKVPAVNDSVSSDYFVELVVPKIIKEGGFKVLICAELCYQTKRFVTDTVAVFLNVRPALNCGDTLRGSSGLTIRKFNMGTKKGRVKVLLSTGGIGDRMDIRQGGKYILSTCTLPKPGQYPKCSDPYSCFPATGQAVYKEYFFDYDPKQGSFIELYMLGYCENPVTAWVVKMGCPQ